MGVAAYNRGSLAISADLCRQYGCPGCARCSTPTVEPRPADWGGKIRAKADKRAAGILRFWIELRGRKAPDVGDLADMIQQGVGCGRKTAKEAAAAALESLGD